MFDDHNGGALKDESIKSAQQLTDISEVQSGGGLIENEERVFGGGFGKIRSEFDSLGFAPG